MEVPAAAAGPGAEPQVFVGRTQGRIVPSRGATAFGWDPVFQPEGFQETYAEMDKAVKNTISHRLALVIAAAWSLDDEDDMDMAAELSASPALHVLQPCYHLRCALLQCYKDLARKELCVRIRRKACPSVVCHNCMDSGLRLDTGIAPLISFETTSSTSLRQSRGFPAAPSYAAA